MNNPLPKRNLKLWATLAAGSLMGLGNDCFMTDDRTGQYKPVPFSQLKPIKTKLKRKKKGNYFTPKI